MPKWPHLSSCPDNFEDFADVLFVVGNEQLPAHSQYWAGHSKLMQHMMREATAFSQNQPPVLDRQLQNFTRGELQTFLDHVYLSPAVGSIADAQALVKVADMFDAAKLMCKAVSYLEKASPDELFGSKDSIVRWLLVAEKYNLASLLTKCARQAALRYTEVRSATRFSELDRTALKIIMDSLHLLTTVHPGVREVRNHSGVIRNRKLSPSDFAEIHPQQIPVSAMQVQQVYMCKCTFKCKIPNGLNPYEGHSVCCGHFGAWDWNLQKQMWQLVSDSAIVAKILPRDVLELAELLGDLPIHRLNDTSYPYVVSYNDDGSPAKCMKW